MPDIGERLGGGKQATVYEYGRDAIKLYAVGTGKAWVFREAANLSAVEELGLPAPHVMAAGRYGECWGLVMDRIAGPSFGEAIGANPVKAGEYLAELARLHRSIHACRPSGLASLKERLRQRIGQVTALSRDEQQGVLALLGRLPDGGQLCHGDFHPFNVMGALKGAVVIDWLDVTSGDPAADLARSYVLMLNLSEALAEAYVDAYSGGAEGVRDGMAAWLPVVAAARLREGVPDETARLLGFVRAGLRRDQSQP